MLNTLTKIFEEIVNNFYKEGVSVTLSDTPETAYCVDDNIVLPVHLLEEFTNQKLPRFTVMYHELGHALYSENMTKLIEKWSNLPASHNSFKYEDKYHHLLNWIEDFHIENKLLENYPFLTDVIGCLKRLTFPYDITEIDKAFNHYYVKGTASPTLSPVDGVYFKQMLTKLINLRNHDLFGHGPISLLSAKSRETQFIRTLIEFYNWCVSKNIFDDSVTLPPLMNPNMILDSGSGLGTGLSADQGNDQSDQSTPAYGDVDPDADQDGQPSKGGAYSAHSHIVGVQQVLPTFDPVETELFHKDFVAEQKLIKDEINKQNRVESTQQSLDGLFNTLFKDSSIIQPKIIVPNFFNPNRLVDQVLFKAPDKSFNNVSIYRDISGSTQWGHEFRLINEICKYLNEKIPIAYNFYLYASGHISILQTSFEDWEDPNDIPDVYSSDPIFNQMSGGTNSSAIADVISEQLNDKWLNIIITDGDLNDLMRRDNIQSLLDNVFVISIEDSNEIKDKCPNNIIVMEESQIPLIVPAILNMKGV